MLFNAIVLSVSSSIDSLGIGITYGLRKLKITHSSKLILFIISAIMTYFSILIGSNLNLILSPLITRLLGSLILIIIGFIIFFEILLKGPIYYDFDFSSKLNIKEAFYLGISLSIDSFCIGLGSSILGINLFVFPILVSVFQLIFLSFGLIIGKKINIFSNIPNNIWNLVSAILLIFIGITRLFI